MILKNMLSLHKKYPILSRAGIALVDQSIISGLNFAVGLYLAKILGVQAFGSFSLIFIIVFLGLEILKSLVTSPMMTYISQQEDTEYASHIILLGISISCILAVFGSAFVFISGFMWPNWQIGDFSREVFFIFLFRLALEFIRRYFFVTLQERKALFVDILSSIVIVCGLAFFYLQKNTTLSAVLSIHALAYGAGCILFLKRAHGRSIINHTETIKNTIIKHWSFGKWLLASTFVMYATSNLMLLMAGDILGSDDIGLVKTVQYTLGGMVVLFQAMDNIIPHRLAQSIKANNKKDFRKVLFYSMAMMTVVCIIHLIAVWIFIIPIMNWFNIKSDALFKELMVLNGVFSLLAVINSGFIYALRALEKTKVIFSVNTVTAVLNILFGYFILTTYHTLGIMYGLIGFQIVGCLIFSVYYYRHSKQHR